METELEQSRHNETGEAKLNTRHRNKDNQNKQETDRYRTRKTENAGKRAEHRRRTEETRWTHRDMVQIITEKRQISQGDRNNSGS